MQLIPYDSMNNNVKTARLTCLLCPVGVKCKISLLLSTFLVIMVESWESLGLFEYFFNATMLS